jgi:hypothetical protein
MNRLTARNEDGFAYLVNIKPDEQEVDSPHKNTLQCILDCFERLAYYEDLEEQGRCVVLPCKLGDVVNTRYGKGEVVAWDTTARLKFLDEPNFVKRYRDFDVNSKIFVCAEVEAAPSEKREAQP